MAQEQLNLFEELNETYKITKKIRLIEFFAGIGSQAKSLEILGVPFETWKTCEWSKESIKAYKQIHHYNEHIEINLTKEELIEKVRGISSNYNEPMSNEQLSRLSLDELKYIHECNLINHNLIDISSVKGSDLEITDTDKYEYVLTYSFPCQDLSLGGLQAGLEEGSNTRSSLLWQVGRILSECENKPQILVMENVDMLVSKKFKKHFDKFLNELKQLGYESFWKILNAKDYGIPQNRKRIFCISILGKDNQYKFPNKMKLKYKLKDFLEKNVAEKFYLSKKMLNYLMKEETGTYDRKEVFMRNFDPKKTIAATICTLAGQRAVDNYVIDNDVKIFDTYNKCYTNDQDAVGAIPAGYSRNQGCVIQVPEATKKGYAEATEGDGIDISGRMQWHRGTVQKGTSQTITTCGGNNVGVVVKVPLKRGYSCEITQESENVNDVDIIGNYSKSNYGQTSIVNRNGIAPTVTENHGQVTAVVVKNESLFTENQAEMIDENGNIKRYVDSDKVDEFKEGQVADISFPKGYNKAKRTHDECPTINTTTTESSFITKETQIPLRIRKLTPCECYKLMGFTKTDYERCKEIQSDSRIWHQAGDSIVVSVLCCLFGTMFDIDYESIVKNYVKELVND